MMAKRYAVIDLGSNTFHLLIVEQGHTLPWKHIYRERIFTALSDGGVQEIKAESMERGLAALEKFALAIRSFQVDVLSVIGTASLRHASNRGDFIRAGERITGVPFRIIDGLTEADYICKGVMLLPELHSGCHLILDIGGGSTECILVRDGKKLWSNSYPLGVGILHALFHKTEPIGLDEISAIKQYITDKTTDMQEVVAEYRPTTLAGASGSFEILESMQGQVVSSEQARWIDPDIFNQLYEKIIPADAAERAGMPGLPPERVKLIVVGMILKKTIFDLVSPAAILVSPFALKEGIIAEMIQHDAAESDG